MQSNKTLAFINKATLKHGNKYDYSLVNYVNVSALVDIICKTHGVFKQSPHSHNKGSGCQKCGGNYKYTSSEFADTANKIHNFKYDYSLVNYKNTNTAVKIICSYHGEFQQTPNVHLTGSGCIKCAGKYQRSNDEFIEDANKIHNFKYNYNLTEFKHTNTEVTITCIQHGNFDQLPRMHLSGQGCSACGHSKTGKIAKTVVSIDTDVKNLLDIINNIKYSKYIKKASTFCKYNGCAVIGNFNYTGANKGIYCDKHKLTDMIDVKNNLCIHENCKTRPSYNYGNKISPVYCNKHKLTDMIDVVSKLCEYKDCTTQPSYNYIDQIKPIYCKQHKLIDMKNIVSTVCQFKNCTNIQPRFNVEGKKSGLYCILHKEDDMIDVKFKKCNFDGCTTSAGFNYIDEKGAIYCSKHKLDDMIALYKTQCKFDGCTIKPIYNLQGEYPGIYCKNHKLTNMIDVANKQCLYEGCTKQPVFNDKDHRFGLYCKDHKLLNMIDVVGKRCLFEECSKQPAFNEEGNKIGIYCNDHKLKNMTNVVKRKCVLCKITQSSKKYDWYCSPCFYFTFPEHVKTTNHKTKENQVLSDLKKEFPNLNIIQDRKIQGGCSLRRPDALIQLNDYNIIIEVDENQHSGYQCDNKRSMTIFQDLGNSPLTIIRFNPDSYTKNGIYTRSPFGTRGVNGILQIVNNKEYKKRLLTLVNTLQENINIIPNKEFNQINLFYSD